jgi:histidine triad (HIT) family protein
MADCLFCKIAAKELDSDIVYESDDVVAFTDINPAAPTHILVIPRRHIPSIEQIARADAELLAEIFEVLVDQANERGLDSGYRIVTNSGPDAGQSVDHLHWHLIGGRQMAWPPG